MEFEKFRRKPLYWCAIVSIVAWFVFLLYIVLTKSDAEHTKGLVEIEGMFRVWKMSQGISEEMKIKEINWLLLKSLRKEMIEIDVVKNNSKQDKVKHVALESLSSFLTSKRKHAIRNWLNNNEDIRLLNRKRNVNNTSVNDTNINPLKYYIISKMRQKIIDIYGDALILPINDSSYIKFRNWRILSSPNGNMFNYNFAPKADRKSAVKVNPSSTPIQSLVHHALGNSKLVSMGNNHIDITTTAEITTFNHTTAEQRGVNDHKELRDDRESMERSEYKFTTNKITADVYKQQLNRIQSDQKLEPFSQSDQKLEPFSQSDQTTELFSQSEENVANISQTDPNLNRFELSLNETNLLSKLSRENSEYADTTSENNIKNEIGPISEYVDHVYDADMKSGGRELYMQWGNALKNSVGEDEISDFSISIKHKKPDTVQTFGIFGNKDEELWIETPPPGVETKSTKSTTKTSTNTKHKIKINTSRKVEHRLLETRITKQGYKE